MSHVESTHRLRVLIVDDDHAALASLEGVLSSDYDVVACTSPLAALDLAGAELARFDVVCSDFQMGEMNGRELLRRISELSDGPSCLLMTGYVELLKGEHGPAPYILGVVVKPYDPLHIIGLIGRLGRDRWISRALRDPAAARRP